MFTGIIAAIGKIEVVQPKGGDLRLQVATENLDLSDVSLGDSVAVNGVCLTVVDISNATLSFDVSRESLERTSLGNVESGSAINLEKALAVGDRLGGHFVSGHVDGLGKVVSKQESARSVIFRIEVPAGLERYIAEKGSICIDGTSLTVNNVADNWFEVNIIPHTMQETIMSSYSVGTKINLEVDLIARYLERLLPQQQGTATAITKETLLKHGFLK
ncbi:MAG: riboflavin synthase [Piscirickettsiaceae bacterium]|nr:riboflavin synthase [Piscirickettsiaceae bacterium]